MNKIRLFNPHTDSEKVSNILEKSFSWYHENDVSNWLYKSLLPNNIVKRCERSYCFVCITNKEISGFISFNISDYGTMYISLIGVDPKYQGKGIGSLLLEKAEKFGIKHNVRNIWLLVTHTNIKAISFYISKKYIPIGTFPNFTKEGLHEIIMYKELKNKK